jgi:hypothetical protein
MDWTLTCNHYSRFLLDLSSTITVSEFVYGGMLLTSLPATTVEGYIVAAKPIGRFAHSQTWAFPFIWFIHRFMLWNMLGVLWYKVRLAYTKTRLAHFSWKYAWRGIKIVVLGRYYPQLPSALPRPNSKLVGPQVLGACGIVQVPESEWNIKMVDNTIQRWKAVPRIEVKTAWLPL